MFISPDIRQIKDSFQIALPENHSSDHCQIILKDKSAKACN